MLYGKWIKDWRTALAENFFLRVLLLLLAIGLILNASIFERKERIVLTPPQLTQEFWIEKNKASPEYLEQMGVFFATLGGNLSPGNAEYNVKVLTSYLSHGGYGGIKEDLASQALYIKRNNITQAFFPLSVRVDGDNNTVTVEGDAIRNIGTRTISREKIAFRMKFVTNNFRLLLDEFYMDYPEREKERLRRKGVEVE